MQKLYFEAAWEHTLATNDRNKISQTFEIVKPNLDEGVQFTFLWEAHNHKGEQLITTLIHNVRPYPLELINTTIQYQQHENLSFISTFHVPEIIPPKSSMPWTFIFSTDLKGKKAPDYIITR